MALEEAKARSRKAVALVSSRRVGFGVGEPRSVVDGDMESLPAETLAGPTAALAAPVAGDAVADAVDPAELLGIDVDQFAGCSHS